LFTLPAVILQPVTGAVLIFKAGLDPWAFWLTVSYALYAVAGLCWLPVVWLQVRMMRMLEARRADGQFDVVAFERLRKTWFALGWPAFGALLMVFFLMVAKPTW
jgi:uncharacterized membrane protein